MTQFAQIHQTFNSLLSIRPLVDVLKKMIADERPGARKLYESLLQEIEARPQLLQPIDNLTPLMEASELVETLLSTIFPPSTAANEGLYAISFPFRHETIYASPGFTKLFLNGGNIITLPDHETTANINLALLNLAYHVILKKLYGFDMPAVASSVHPFTNSETGVLKYLELKLNAQFVEVKKLDAGFKLPPVLPQRSLDTDALLKILPLEKFQFEGLVVLDVADVTGEQVIAELKNTLLTLTNSTDTSVYHQLELHIETLLALSHISIGITPFVKLNDLYLYADAQYTNSLLYKSKAVIANHEKVVTLCQQLFRDTNDPVLYQSLNDVKGAAGTLLNYYKDLHLKSLILCPLRSEDGALIGLLEIGSDETDALRVQHLSKLQPAMPLFSLALEKSRDNLELQINKTIKEHFTAIQTAVEWKFTETAFQYINNRQANDAVKMGAITFGDVHPLYGAIDIRNSSVERTHAIQLDMLEQLKCAHDVLSVAAKGKPFPLLNEYLFKIDQYINTTSDQLLTEEEMAVYDFMEHDLDGLFKHLLTTHPDLKKHIDGYFAALDAQRGIIYHHRKEYEDSITKINDVLDRFMDVEQAAAQQVFPHYFERYITDGIEFNIYVGQTLAPAYPFNEIYVKNLKLWQITFLAKAARLTYGLEKKLPLPLQTTQLVLAHSIPLTISFRRKERKFDVDGAYNIRYEIIKKRIDKVHLKDSEERLTQPGKIAIVYSQQKELNEYLEYIHFLQGEKLLSGTIEHLELEDTQGISGLKAIRIDVNLTAIETPQPKVALSKTTSHELVK